MQSILRALRPHDRFNLVAFADAPHVWREDGPIPATTSQIRSAARYIESLEADGCEYHHEHASTTPKHPQNVPKTSPKHPQILQGPTWTARCWRRPPSSATTVSPRSPACPCCSS